MVSFQTNATNGNVAAKKGDIVITSERLFEIVTRVYLAIQAGERRTINVNIANKYVDCNYCHDDSFYGSRVVLNLGC